MKQATKIKSAAADWPIPTNRDEADRFIYRIGCAMRGRAGIQADLDAELADLKARYEKRVAPFNEAIEQRTKGLQTWCEANRAELLDGDSKTVKFGNGEVAWRMRPASVNLRGVEKVIEWCRAHRLSRFLRIKTEINKEAMLADPVKATGIPGVSIASAGEDFIVTPLSAELEEVAL